MPSLNPSSGKSAPTRLPSRAPSPAPVREAAARRVVASPKVEETIKGEHFGDGPQNYGHPARPPKPLKVPSFQRVAPGGRRGPKGGREVEGGTSVRPGVNYGTRGESDRNDGVYRGWGGAGTGRVPRRPGETAA